MIFFPPVTPELEAGVIEKGSKVEGPRRGDATKTFAPEGEFRVFTATERRNPKSASVPDHSQVAVGNGIISARTFCVISPRPPLSRIDFPIKAGKPSAFSPHRRSRRAMVAG
jgi:hypothetical protein